MPAGAARSGWIKSRTFWVVLAGVLVAVLVAVVVFVITGLVTGSWKVLALSTGLVDKAFFGGLLAGAVAYVDYRSKEQERERGSVSCAFASSG